MVGALGEGFGALSPGSCQGLFWLGFRGASSAEGPSLAISWPWVGHRWEGGKEALSTSGPSSEPLSEFQASPR